MRNLRLNEVIYWEIFREPIEEVFKKDIGDKVPDKKTIWHFKEVSLNY